MRVFERHESWGRVQNFIKLCNDADQDRVHEWIYALKAGASVELARQCTHELLRKYEVTSWVAGCTEMHLMFRPDGPDQPVDPLVTIALRVSATGNVWDPARRSTGHEVPSGLGAQSEPDHGDPVPSSHRHSAARRNEQDRYDETSAQHSDVMPGEG